MAFHLLRILLFFSSGLIIGVGLSFFVLGPHTTFGFLLELVKPLLDDPDIIADMATPNVDSEIRTLAPFLIGYGVLVFLTAKHLRTHLYYVPHLLFFFVAAAMGRLISYFAHGTAHPLFYVMAGVELGIPFLIFAVYKAVLSKITYE